MISQFFPVNISDPVILHNKSYSISRGVYSVYICRAYKLDH